MDADQVASRDADEETVWSFHSLVMNGGIAHAIEVSDALGVARADLVSALGRLALDELAALVERVAADEDVDDECTDAWSDVVPTDAALEERITRASPGAASEADAEERAIVEDLRAVGLDVPGVHRLRDQADRHPGMRRVLLDHLRRGYSDNVRAALAAALAGKGIGEVLDEVLELYRAEEVPHVKEQYADALARSGPRYVDVVMDLIRDASLGRSRVLLVQGLTRSKRPEARETLESLREDPDLKVEIAERLKSGRGPAAPKGKEPR